MVSPARGRHDIHARLTASSSPGLAGQLGHLGVHRLLQLGGLLVEPGVGPVVLLAVLEHEVQVLRELADVRVAVALELLADLKKVRKI